MLFLTFTSLLSLVGFSFAQTTDDIPSCIRECLGPDLQAPNGRYVFGVPVKPCPVKDLACRCADPGWTILMGLCSDPCPDVTELNFCEVPLKSYGLNVTAVYERIHSKLSTTPTPWLSIEGNLLAPTETTTTPAAEETSPPKSVSELEHCALECLHLNTSSSRSSELGIPVRECGGDWECRCTDVGWFISWNMCGDFCDDAEAAFRLTCKDIYTRLSISETEVARRFLHDLKKLGRDGEMVIQWLKFRLQDSSSGVSVVSVSPTASLKGTKTITTSVVTRPAMMGTPVGELRI